MKVQVRKLAQWFEPERWPVLECPVCGTGTLSAKKDAITAIGNRATSTWQEWGGPDDIEGIFFGHLTCNNHSCGDNVATSSLMPVPTKQQQAA
ncbi:MULTISPECIES: hypothetical protein [Nocardia]|uniref:hypothetical protein n=1 Tax=Nocardia TaxID=1817 RepID=UPI001357ED27|nr:MULTISPECIES: hypothetical protein [Nocardia]